MYKKSIFFIFAVMLSSVAAAQDEPSLADTKEHVESIMKGSCIQRGQGDSSELVMRVREGSARYSIDDTTFTYEFIIEATSFGASEVGLTMVTTEHVHLDKLDPTPDVSKTGTGIDWILFTCTKGKCVDTKTVLTSRVGRVVKDTTEIKLSIPPCGDQTRFARAFSTLIKLSGGKPALF